MALREERKSPQEFRSLNALPISFAEFTVACRDYPIAFVGASAESVIAMAVLGLEKQQNLFVTAGDDWDASVYLPAYVRRHPFCMTRVTVDGKERAGTRCLRREKRDQGPPLAMTGLYRVSEQKLADRRAPGELKVLLQKGILARVYAHLVSLANFGRLLDRCAAQSRRG